MALNGRLLATSLRKISGVSLSKPTANAFERMIAAAKKDGIALWAALPIGGYRNYATQADMHVHPERYGLAANAVGIAKAGQSTHGFGTRVDIGSVPPDRDILRYGEAGKRRKAWLLRNAPDFGFVREFGENDWNHFKHNGTTGITPMTVTLEPNQRQVGKAVLKARAAATTTSREIEAGKRSPGEVLDIQFYERGTAPAGTTNNIWFITASGRRYWSGGFTNPKVGTIPEYKPASAPVATFTKAEVVAEVLATVTPKIPTATQLVAATILAIVAKLTK